MSTLSLRHHNVLYAAIAFAVLALLFGLWLQYNQSEHTKSLNIDNGTIFQIPHNIEPFHLVTSDQKPFTNLNLEGRWSVLFFGFTQCPQMCPTTLSVLNDAYKRLAEKKKVPLPQIVFISVDPSRDTPDVIKKYIGSFNQAFLGATGSQDEIKRLTASLNILYMKVKNPQDTDPMSYQIDHSGTLLFVNPEGKLLALFSGPHEADSLADSISLIESYYSNRT